MKCIIHRITILLLLLIGTTSVFGQQKLKFSVVSFGSDVFDTTAKDDRHKRVDGSGSLYAIIKVTSDSPNDNLNEYNFNFGNMNCIVENHDDQLWLYVQKNAKMVTITRSGYNPLRNYDLHTTIESGKTYIMHLSAQGPIIYTQMVMFQTEPKIVGAVIMIQREGEGNSKELFGTTGATGGIAKSLVFGTYTYEVMAENYYNSEGRFTLNSQSETHQEKVMLRSNSANITLTVASDADIYVNNNKKGVRSWSGLLKAGTYQVECRQANHRNSMQNITVEENVPRTITLTPPSPITGVLAVTSNPLGATIRVNDNDYGTTPRNITNLLIGQHEVTLSLNGYDETKAMVEVKENETTELNISLSDVGVSLKKANDLYKKKEYAIAVEIYQSLANQGNAEAQCNLGYCYENGDGVEQDMRKAFEWYEKAAIQGYARAQHNLGVCLSNGEGVDKDPKKAFEWYEKAAVQGFALSQHNLGNFYSNGIVVDKDVRKAIEWWEKAAIQGYAGSQHNIGFCYYNGEGVEKNLNKAFYWYEKAANQGYPDSQYATGYCYNYGEGVNKDHKKAFEWYEKAANQGHAVAQNNLGACYEDGIGVAKDLKKAFEWYEKSANQGVAIAQKNLELCYEYGKGVAKDLQKAAYWKKKYEENPNK